MREAGRARWTEALRSGRYHQGVGYLRRGDDWCCLGVACEVYRELTGDGEWVEYHEGIIMFLVGDDERETRELPDTVRDFFGLTDYAGSFESDHENRTDVRPGACLARLNDGGADFARIADVIDEAPRGLFVTD